MKKRVTYILASIVLIVSSLFISSYFVAYYKAVQYVEAYYGKGAWKKHASSITLFYDDKFTLQWFFGFDQGVDSNSMWYPLSIDVSFFGKVLNKPIEKVCQVKQSNTIGNFVGRYHLVIRGDLTKLYNMEVFNGFKPGISLDGSTQMGHLPLNVWTNGSVGNDIIFRSYSFTNSIVAVALESKQLPMRTKFQWKSVYVFPHKNTQILLENIISNKNLDFDVYPRSFLLHISDEVGNHLWFEIYQDNIVNEIRWLNSDS